MNSMKKMLMTCTNSKTYVIKLLDIGFGNDFLDMTPKAQAVKDKIDKLNFIEIF